MTKNNFLHGHYMRKSVNYAQYQQWTQKKSNGLRKLTKPSSVYCLLARKRSLTLLSFTRGVSSIPQWSFFLIQEAKSPSFHEPTSEIHFTVSLYRVSIVLKLEKCAKFNMDSFPLKLCRLHVMKNIHSSSNATVQVMEAGYFRTSGSSHKHRRPHHTNTTKESAFLWQMSTSHNSIAFTTIIIIIHCNNRNTVGLHFLQAFILWHVYRKNIYRIQKAYTSLSNRI